MIFETVPIKKHLVPVWTETSAQALEDWALGEITYDEFLQRFGEQLKENIIKGTREKLTDEGTSVEGMTDDEVLQYTSLQF